MMVMVLPEKSKARAGSAASVAATLSRMRRTIAFSLPGGHPGRAHHTPEQHFQNVAFCRLFSGGRRVDLDMIHHEVGERHALRPVEADRTNAVALRVHA